MEAITEGVLNRQSQRTVFLQQTAANMFANTRRLAPLPWVYRTALQQSTRAKEQSTVWDLLLQSPVQQEFTVSCIGVSTWEGAAGQWRFWTPAGAELPLIHTQNQYEEYIRVPDLNLTGHTQVKFEVEAANDAYVQLMLDKGGLFEVMIGGSDNTKCAFRLVRMGFNIAEWQSVVPVLASDMFSTFLLSWQLPGVLQLWRKSMTKYDDPQPSVPITYLYLLKSTLKYSFQLQCQVRGCDTLATYFAPLIRELKSLEARKEACWDKPHSVSH